MTGTAQRPPDDAITQSSEEQQGTGVQAMRIGTILWPSFFSAGVATMVFFAIVDPIDLSEMAWPHVRLSRELGYSIGFFMFWSCTLSSSWFTALLLRPLHKPRADMAPR